MNGLLEKFTTPLDPDAFLALLGPRHTRRLQGVIESITPLTATSAAIAIRPGRSWRPHIPGQHVTVGVDVDGVRHSRSYSLTSLPADSRGRIEIAVRAKKGGFVSAHLVGSARVGDVVQLSEADGDFTLPVLVPHKLFFATGGSGITPVLGMLRSLAASGATPDTMLIHHTPRLDDAMFAAELEALGRQHGWLDVKIVETRDGGRYLDAERLAELCPDWEEREAYVCGPESLIDVVMSCWSDAGRARNVHLERFVAPSAYPAATGAGGTVRFAASQLEVDAAADTPLLEVAEAAGLLPPSGCRMGICRTCSTRLDDGCVRDLRDGRVLDAGAHVQICVSVADGDISLDL